MNLKAKQIEIESSSAVIGRLVAEPFLVIGMTLFWTLALPAAAVFVLLAKFEPVFVHLSAAQRVPSLTGRLTQGAA